MGSLSSLSHQRLQWSVMQQYRIKIKSYREHSNDRKRHIQFLLLKNKSRKGQSHMTSHRVRTSPKAFERQPGSRQSSKAATDCSNKRSLQSKFWSPWTLRCQSHSVDELCLFSRSPDQSTTIAMKQLGIYSQGFELILYLRRPHDRNTVKTVSCGRHQQCDSWIT